MSLKNARCVDVSCGDKFTVIIVQRVFTALQNLKKIKDLTDYCKSHEELDIK
jgi:hypothetical protein